MYPPQYLDICHGKEVCTPQVPRDPDGLTLGERLEGILAMIGTRDQSDASIFAMIDVINEFSGMHICPLAEKAVDEAHQWLDRGGMDDPTMLLLEHFEAYLGYLQLKKYVTISENDEKVFLWKLWESYINTQKRQVNTPYPL